jgi:protein TonB
METRSALTSVSIHAGVLLLIFGLAVATAPVAKLPSLIDLTQKHRLPPYRPATGGAARDRKPPSFGTPPPRVAARIFVPPQVSLINMAPKLIMVAALDTPPSLIPATNQIGDPTGLGRLLSGGINGTGGIGTGDQGKIGSGNSHEGIYTSGRGGVTAPVPIHRVEPEYSEEARKAHAMGSVLVMVEVGPDGRVHNARVARSIGLGLDEKAMEAVLAWRFRPGTKDGKPVTVQAQIEVTFHLL